MILALVIVARSGRSVALTVQNQSLAKKQGNYMPSNKIRTDTNRLNALERLLGKYTGKVSCRWSNSGRGWRLHESSREDAVSSVRIAIDTFLDENGE